MAKYAYSYCTIFAFIEQHFALFKWQGAIYAMNTLNLQQLYDELYPLCRSLTGTGYEQSLDILKRYIPFQIENYPCGSKVLDWTVPNAWELKRACLKDLQGNIILDSDINPLHVVNYSEPFSGVVSLEELQQHLYSDHKNPKAIPYVISYYKDRWGFCLTQEMRDKLNDEYYRVEIDTVKSPNGNVKVGVCDLIGSSKRIVQISAYLCHPNMLNNELSGPIAMVYLYQLLKAMPNRQYTYRFVINPETIGSICYLSKHAQELKENLEYGMVLTCLAAPYNQNTLQHTKEQDRKTQCELDLEYSNYFDLLSRMESCYCHDFLKLPLSFKRTRQSFIDEIKSYFEHNIELNEKQQHLESASQLKNELELITKVDASQKKITNADNFVLTTIKDPQLSDEVKIKDYAQCERNFDTLGSNNIEAVSTVVPYGLEYKFNYSYGIDNALAYLAHTNKEQIALRRFVANSGSDERQYCSALLNLPVVQVTRTQYACYPSYHTSEDNQSCFSLNSLVDSAVAIFSCLRYLELRNSTILSTIIGEPQLGKRGLYPDINSPKVRSARNSKVNSMEVLMTILNLCDGTFNIDQLAQITKVSPLELAALIEHLVQADVIVIN